MQRVLGKDQDTSLAALASAREGDRNGKEIRRTNSAVVAMKTSSPVNQCSGDADNDDQVR